MRIRVDIERPAPRQLAPAAEAARKGGVILYPSDTGYAFGCALSSTKGIATLRRLKGVEKGSRKHLAMMVNEIGDFGKYGVMDNRTFRLVRRILPGAYTIVLKASIEVPRPMKNRDHEIGLRMPDNAVCRMLVDLLEEPLLVGSVTPADEEPKLEDAEIFEARYRADVACVIDGGPLWPAPSTVLRAGHEEIEVLREGQGPVPS